MKSSARVVTSFVAAVTATAVVLASSPNPSIKLGTVVPTGSTWYKALLDLGDAWQKTTSGRVTLSVLASKADESEVVDKMRPAVDQFQAGLLLFVGLADIDKAFNVFGVPFFFASDAEEAAVQKQLTPTLDARLQAKGFHLLSWGNGGWVQLFSKTPIRTLADVKKAKLYTSAGDPDMVQWYQSNGFNPQPLSVGDMVAQLQLRNGAIDAAPNSPYGASVFGIFRYAKYMLDLHVGPIVGALVITDAAWNQIAPADRTAMTTAAQAFERQVNATAPAQDATALAEMTKRGLTVVTLDAKAQAEFRAEAEKMSASMRGKIVPADIYDAALQARTAYRQHGGK